MDLNHCLNILRPGWKLPAGQPDWLQNISQIADYLYLGDLMAATNKHLLQEKGITHIVQCIPAWDEPFNEFEYLILPALDDDNYDLESFFDRACDFIDQAIQSGGVIFVHCAAGISRSSSIVLAHLMRTHRLPYGLAFKWVRRMRPMVQPNPGFVKQLRRFEERLGLDEISFADTEDEIDF